MQTLIPRTKEAVIQFALWQIGVMESPSGSNKVKYNTEFYGREVSGSSYPWCMTFVWACFHAVGFNLAKTASCSELTRRYKNAGQVVYSGYKPGDIAMFDFSGKRQKTVHTGLIVEVHDGYVVTVEGNTSTSSNDNGGKVMKRIRKNNLITLACRPGYNM